MKIEAINGSNVQKKGFNSKNTAFKSSLGMNLLSASGALMQGIESKGYAVSFLIQDGLGMTLPRTLTGFNRDKEVTGEWNFKEGLEVLGREGLTGPFMMSVAPIMLWLTGKYCKSAGTNTRLIKIVGDNLKSMIENPGFKDSIKNDKAAFKKEFIKYNVEKFYKDSIPNDKNSEETINFIVKEWEKLDSKDKKIREEGLNNINAKLNDKMVSESADLKNICKLTMDINGKKHTYSTDDFIKAIDRYAKDAIENNPNYKNIGLKEAENIKNNFAAKRLGFNILTAGSMLTGLSYLPKLYAYNSVAPGAQHLVKNSEEENKNDNKENLTFKGKGINSEGIVSKIGNFLTKKVPAWIQREFEYNGYNFTASLMAGLSLFGLLAPRCKRAYDRALVDENGNKDMTEIHEILLRDTISSLGVVYTVPILQKGIVSSYENKKGFILTNRASMGKSGFKKFIDAINPYSDLTLFSNKELQALYGNIDSKAKIVNFAKFIEKNKGDLANILSYSENVKEVFNEKTFTLESLKGKSLKDKNRQIVDFFEKMEDNKSTKDLIVKLMNDKGIGKKSSISKMARGLNSVPGFISTVLISPILLGWIIPKLTYSNTRKKHAKMNFNQNQNQTNAVA